MHVVLIYNENTRKYIKLLWHSFAQSTAKESQNIQCGRHSLLPSGAVIVIPAWFAASFAFFFSFFLRFASVFASTFASYPVQVVHEEGSISESSFVLVSERVPSQRSSVRQPPFRGHHGCGHFDTVCLSAVTRSGRLLLRKHWSWSSWLQVCS